jgi:hypothetical protein
MLLFSASVWCGFGGAVFASPGRTSVSITSRTKLASTVCPLTTCGRPIASTNRSIATTLLCLVDALRPGCRQRVTPEILDILHMCGVGPQLADDMVVKLVCAVAEFDLPFQNDHRRRVGVKLVEHLANWIMALNAGACLGVIDTAC